MGLVMDPDGDAIEPPTITIGVNRRPWHTPTVTEVPIESLPTELRMTALGLPVPEPNSQVVLEGGAVQPAQPEYGPEDLPF